jgi:putative ABC transport system substrate-binding protein
VAPISGVGADLVKPPAGPGGPGGLSSASGAPRTADPDRRGICREAALTVLALASPRPRAAGAQPGRRPGRLAFLANGSAAASGPLLESLRTGLRDLGHVEGQTLVIVPRFADGREERIPGLVRELLATRPDIIVAAGHRALSALKAATPTVPIVMAIISDPVESGLVASLARPGGNLTGLAFQNRELTAKRLELLKETLPALARVAVLGDHASPANSFTEAEMAARVLQVQLQVLAIKGPADLAGALASAATGRAEALLVLASPFLFANRQTLVGLAARHRLPASYEAKTFVDIGGLMSYGPNFSDMYRRSAAYVDKILRGGRPADLPVEQLSQFELAINIRAARALGLSIPQLVLSRADAVIE